MLDFHDCLSQIVGTSLVLGHFSSGAPSHSATFLHSRGVFWEFQEAPGAYCPKHVSLHVHHVCSIWAHGATAGKAARHCTRRTAIRPRGRTCPRQASNSLLEGVCGRTPEGQKACYSPSAVAMILRGLEVQDRAGK